MGRIFKITFNNLPQNLGTRTISFSHDVILVASHSTLDVLESMLGDAQRWAIFSFLNNLIVLILLIY